MDSQEPQGVETFRTVAKLGFDTSPAITSIETLAESIRKLDSSLNSLIERSRTASVSLQEAFARAESQGLQALLSRQETSMSSLSAASMKKQLSLFQELANQRLLIEQDTEKKILQMREASIRTLQQTLGAQQKRLETLAQGRLRGQMPFGEAASYRMSWFASGAAFYGSLRAIRAIVDAAGDMETILVELKKVMDERQTDFDAMRETILDTAQSYGLLTDEVGKLAIEFGRQGRSQKEIEQLLRPAALLMNVAEVKNAEDAVRYLTAATRQFGLEAKDAMRVVDVWNLVSNRFGVTAEGLAQAVTRAGSVAHTTGVTLEQMAGHVAALSEATGKSGEEIGTSLKTVYSYLLRPETIKVLEQMGFKVRESADSYRDLADIIADIAGRWNELTEVEQYHLAQKAAGVRRISDFIALLRNHDRAVQATITAMAAAGSAERENEKFLESYEKQVAQLKATVQELAITLGEGALLPVLRGVVSGTKDAIQVYQELDPTLRQLIETVGLLAAGLKVLNMASVALGGQTLLARLGGLQAIKGMVSSLLTSPWAQGTAITAIGAGIGILSSGAVEKAKKDAAELAKRLEESQQAYQALTQVIAESEEGTLKHITASRELQEVMNRFGGLAPEIVMKWDDEGNAIEISTEKLEQRIQKEKEFAGVTLEDLRQRMEDSKAYYEKWLRMRELFAQAWHQLGLSEAESEERAAEQTRKAHDKQVADTKAFFDALALARAEGYEKAFGTPQQPKYRDPITGEWRQGMFPTREERHIGAEPEYWKGIERGLPAVERAKETLEKLTDTEKALALQHERELALLPAYATSIDEVNVKLRQNAESIEQARKSQALMLKERENIRKALETEKKTHKDLEEEYNNLAREYAGVVQLPEDIKDSFDELSKKLREHEANIKTLEGQYDSLDTKAEEYGNTVISLSTESIQLDRERNRLLDQYNDSLRKAQQTLEDILGVQQELSDIDFAKQWASFWDNQEQIGQLEKAELEKELEYLQTQGQRLLREYTQARERRATPEELLEIQGKIAENWAQQTNKRREIELQDAKITKDRVDREKEADEEILESKRLAREKDLQEKTNAVKVQLSLTKEGSEAYVEFQNQLDELTIQQKGIAKERLYAQLKEGLSPEKAAAVVLELSKLQGEMEELQIGISKRSGDLISQVWAKDMERAFDLLVNDVRMKAEDKIKQLREFNEQLIVKGAEGAALSEKVESAIQKFADEVVTKQNEALKASAIAGGFGLTLGLAEANVEPDLDVRAKRRAEVIEKFVREDLQKITGSLLLTPEQQIAKLDELLDKYLEFEKEVPEVYALIAKAREDLTSGITERFREYLTAIGQQTESELDAVEDLAKGYNLETEEGRIQWTAVRAAERGKVWARVADEQVQAILDNVRLTTADKLQALRNLNTEFLVKGVEGIEASDKIQESVKKLADTFMTEYLDNLKEALDVQGMERELAEVLVSGKPAEVMEKLTREIVDKYIGEGISRISSNVLYGLGDKERELLALQERFLPYAEKFPDLYAKIGESIRDVRTEQAELNAALKEAGLEPLAKVAEETANALEKLNLENKTVDVQTLQKRLELTRKLLEARKAEYDERLRTAQEFAAKANVPFETIQAGGEPLTQLRQTLKGDALVWLEKAVTLAESLPAMDMKIVQLGADIADLGKEIALLPVQEKFAALNSSLEEFSRFMTQAALAEEYFAEGLFADVKRMELLREKMQATKQVAEAYRTALESTRERLLASKELTDDEMKLVELIASGIPLTKEQADAFAALTAKYEKANDTTHVLLVALKSLRDENGNLSKSILDQAFSLYRATLAAKGLAKAYDAILSGAEELRDTFDYRQELRGLEEKYNYNYIFGRPGERAMEDWQAEFDDIKRDMEAIAKISAGLRVLRGTKEDEKALEKLKQELKELAQEKPALGITQKQIDSLGKDIPEAMNLAAIAAGNLEGSLESLVSKRYFLELAREAEEMGRSFEQNIEGAFERAISDVIKGEGDLLNILITFGQNIVGSMADMLAQGLTRRIFGDPNNPNSLAGRITQWATGKAGDTLGIQTSMTTGAQVAGTTMQTAIVTAGQQVASMWSAVLRTSSIGMPGVPGIPGVPGMPGDIGSVAGWRMLEAASMTIPTAVEGSVAGWRMLETASMAGAAAGGGGFLSALLGGGGAPLLAGFDPVTMLATFAIGALLSGMQKKLSQPLAPTPKDQYNYKIYSSEFNPFASPERAYYSGSDRAITEVANLNFGPNSVVINARDGTDAATKFFRQLRTLETAGAWGRRK